GVVAEVLARILNRLPRLDVGGEMDDGFDLVILEGLVERVRIGDLADEQRRAADRFAVALLHVIEDDDLITGLLQRMNGVAADVAGASGDEDLWHSKIPLPK